MYYVSVWFRGSFPHALIIHYLDRFYFAKTTMNRKQRREHIAPFILHSKEFGSKGLREETLEDGSIKFYFEGYASTIAKDGSGDIVMPAGIKLERYKKNPIIKI